MMQEELLESEAKFQHLAEYSPTMIFIYKNENIIYVNPRCEEVMGYHREDFYAPEFDILTLIAPESVEQVTTSLQAHMNGKEVSPHEYTLITRQGERVDTVISTKLIRHYGEPAILGIVTNLTEQKQLRDTLNQSEVRYRTLINAAPDGIVTLSLEGMTISINPAFTRMTGYSEDDIVGTPFTELICASDALLFLKMLGIFLDKPRNAMLEFRFHRKDGVQRWGEAHVSEVMSGGKLMNLLVIFRDVTTRKDVEAALRASEAKYMSVVEHTRDGIVILQDGVVKFVNSASENLVHFRPNELQGRSFLSFVDPAHRAVVMQRYSDRLQGKEVAPIYQTVLMTKAGTQLPVEVNATIIEYEGRPADLVFIRDLSER